MASKQPKKLFDLQNKLKVYSNRIYKFFKHKMLSQRKNALIIDNSSSSIFKQLLLKKLNRTWNLTQVSLQQHESHALINPQTTTNSTQLKQIQQKLIGMHFDSIIVLPKSTHHQFNIDNQDILTQYNPIKDMQTYLLAYRLAHKYLSTSGILILSASQKDFIKEEFVKDQPKSNINQSTSPLLNIISPSKYITDCQLNYLGVIIGDRDYTDLNSWSVIGLSEEVAIEDPQFVSNMYTNWADGIKIPMPGSFALFRRKNNKCSFVEYL